MTDKTVEDWLADLKAALIAETDAGKLERLAAALIGKMVGVQVTVARSGFQFGGDAGASGRQGRRLRLEAKRYLESTRHNDRELLGELDQAVAADPALEAWLLVTTRSVVEQTELQLSRKGEAIGVPVIFLDWKVDAPFPALAALCAFDPTIVGELFSPETEEASRALETAAAPAIAALRRDLETWNLGYSGLRSAAATALNDIWNKPRQAMANFGQDAAGGAEPKKIRRQQVYAALDDWWAGPASTDAPAILLGLGGAGKTWAALDWLVDCQADLPIILTAPSAMGAAIGAVSEMRIKELLAQRLYELSPLLDHAYWLRRVDRLLRRPIEEGPVILVLFDGVNQEQSAPWLKMFRMLQGQNFAGRVRVIASTRPLHNEQELGGLQGLIAPAVTIPVALYDLEPGGELDQMLALEGLDRSALDPQLIELARVPRLFKLVVRFGARLIEAGQVTVHRLLWEYGRDTLGVRAGVSFSEAEWRDWLVSIAKDVRNGVETYSRARLSQSFQQAHLTPGQVFQRMSEIVDSKLVDHSGTSVRPIPLLVDHALAAALLDHLGRFSQPSAEAVDAALLDWLDPIAGLDERARILRAAVSIQIETGQGESALTGFLVVAWLQGQNTPDQHRREVEKLAPLIVEPLLSAVWRSRHPAQTSAKTWALRALDAIARDDFPALSRIVSWARHGLSEISRDVHPRHASEPQIESHRRKRVLDHLGFDENGERLVLGVSMRVVDNHDAEMGHIVSRVLKGFPLAPAMPAFEVAAISASAGDKGGWDALAWLCLLNEVDPEEMAQALRVLSADVLQRRPEGYVSEKLATRTAARLVRLTGREEDDRTASKLRPPESQEYSYEKNYLPRPIASFGYALEARHVHHGLLDREVPFRTRSNKSSAFWLDPDFQPQALFVSELIRVSQEVDLKLLDAHGSQTSEDIQFEELTPMLARSAPQLLADLMRGKVVSFSERPLNGRYWAAIHATDDILVQDGTAKAPANALRTKAKCTSKNEETFAASMLLALETLEASPFDQIEAFVSADLAFILMDLEKVIKPLTETDRARLLDRFKNAPSRQCQNLAMLMSFHAQPLDERTWQWFEVMAKGKDDDGRGIAFRALTRSDPGRFGQTLLSWDWRWEPKGTNDWTTHFGSVALIKASLGLPFEQIMDRVAPWLLPYAVRERGADPEEGELVGEVLGRILATTTGQAFDPGVDINVTVDKELDDPWPYSLAERDDPNPPGDFNERLAGLLDGAMRRERRQKSIEAALDHIRAAQEGGAYLVLRGLSKRDLEGIVAWAPEQVDRWLEGMEVASDAFLDRVHFGEHLFLSLCLALLDVQPERGAALWRALRAAFTSTRFLGKARINALVLAPFQAQSSAPVEALRLELFDPPYAKTDAHLFEVVQAALIEGRSDWLEARLAEDRASPLVWRRRRAELVAGWLPGAIKGPFWFEGLADTSFEVLRRNSVRSARTDAWARHWWQAYLSAITPEAAYAAWTLFMAAADRRAFVWMSKDRAEIESAEMAAARARHEGVNRQRILGDLEKKPKDLADRFLGLNIVKGVGLWAEDEAY